MLYHIIQFTWGLPQNIIGLIMYLLMFRYKSFRYHEAYVRVWKHENSLSMGQYLFVSEKYNRYLLSHEYGHSIQSLYLGPLYLILVGIPSCIWCNSHSLSKMRDKKGIGYYDAPFEANATKLGKVHSKKYG